MERSPSDQEMSVHLTKAGLIYLDVSELTLHQDFT